MSADPLWPEGVARHVLAEVDSTNAEATRLAPGLSGPAWILGLRQTAGRGRRGRGWDDPQGNFAGTLVFRPSGSPGHVAMYSFVAALALFDTFVAVSGRTEPFALKWPNDVLLNGGKVAGILLESISKGQRVAHLAIGFGVNLREAPEAAPGAVPPVSLMAATGANVTPEEFLDLLAPAFARWQRRFEQDGFAPVRTAWLERAARLGEVITARTVSETHEGIFRTLDDSGALVLETARGRLAIPAADVYFN